MGDGAHIDRTLHGPDQPWLAWRSWLSQLGLALTLAAAVGCTGLTGATVAPTPVPTASPTPDVPRLTPNLVLALVADRLRGAGLAVDVQRTGRATYLGNGQWRVVYRSGEWLVQEADYDVVTANQQARDLEAAPSPGR